MAVPLIGATTSLLGRAAMSKGGQQVIGSMVANKMMKSSAVSGSQFGQRPQASAAPVTPRY